MVDREDPRRPSGSEPHVARSPGPPELMVLANIGAIDRIADEWRTLAAVSARTPFESPDWLLPWWAHFGRGAAPRVLAWFHGGSLVGVAPLLVRRQRRFRLWLQEIAFWGSAGPLLRGYVDLVAMERFRADLESSLVAWLQRAEDPWDIVSMLRLPAGSTTGPAVMAWARARGLARVSLSGVVRSTTHVLALPGSVDAWRRQKGQKVRHNLRREVRLFERHKGGRIQLVTDPSETARLVDALSNLMARRWGEAEAYFGPDPRFRAFITDAASRMTASRMAYWHIAQDDDGVKAVLLTLALDGRAVATLIGVDRSPAYAPFSLGKNLLDAAIEEAIARDCRLFDFLWVGDYKHSYWRAQPEDLASLTVGRGFRGWAAIAPLWLAGTGRRRPEVPRRDTE